MEALLGKEDVHCVKETVFGGVGESNTAVFFKNNRHD